MAEPCTFNLLSRGGWSVFWGRATPRFGHGVCGLRVGDVGHLHFFELRCLNVTEFADYFRCFSSTASGLAA